MNKRFDSIQFVGGFAGALISLSTPLAGASESTMEASSAPAPVVEAKKLGEVVFDFTGFAWFEVERNHNFGFGSTSATADFAPSAHSASTFLSNLQVNATRGPTKLTSIFEVGEIIAGDNASGGAQGARQKVTEVRNFFLTHKIDDRWTLRAGLQPVLSDPNAFILSDHYMSEAFDYSDGVTTATLWHAKAYADRPGLTAASTDHVNPDDYIGVNSALPLGSNVTGTFYGLYRDTIESLYDTGAAATKKGRSSYHWIGATLDAKVSDSVSLQATHIYNGGSFSADTGGSSDTLTASLSDLKVKATSADKGLELLVEGLATTGSSDSVASGQTATSIGKRRSFVSPDPGAAYLFSIATNDGTDEATGAPKQAIIGNLSQSTGLNIALVRLTKKLSDRSTGFVRVGLLRAASKSLATDSDDMGHEVDIGTTIEISPGTTLQFDFGRLEPGSYYANREAAVIAVSRLRFGF